MNIEFFHINLNLASVFNCSNIPVDSIKSACLQLNQSLEQALGLFFAGIAIIFVLAAMGVEINGMILYQNILWSVVGILISTYMGQDYTLDVVLLILSVVTSVTGKHTMLISFLIFGYNLLKILSILQSI